MMTCSIDISDAIPPPQCSRDVRLSRWSRALQVVHFLMRVPGTSPAVAHGAGQFRVVPPSCHAPVLQLPTYVVRKYSRKKRGIVTESAG